MESEKCDEDVDLYDDLPDFNMEASLHKLEAENKELTQKVKDLSSRVAELETQNTELSRMNKNLRANISALLKTVQKEIQRKENTINELRQEREDLFFRRKKPYNQDTRTHLYAGKQIDQPIDESGNSGGRRKCKKDASLPETATRQNHSSGEKKIPATVAKRSNGELLSIATTNAISASVPQTDSCRNPTTVRQSSPLLSSTRKELSDRPKTPTVYRLIPLPQANHSERLFQAKRLKSTMRTSRDQSSGGGALDPKTQAESDHSRKILDGESGEGVVRISGEDTLVDPRIIRNIRGVSTVPEEEKREILCGQTEGSPTSTELTSQASSTSPIKPRRKPKSARLYVKTRSSARLSAKLSAQETSNEGEVSVLEALQLEERIKDDFANSPMPEILSPIVSFQDNEKSLSPLRFPAGLGLSGPSSLPSSTPVSGMSSLLEGALKNLAANSNLEQLTPPLTECANSSSRLPVSSDKLRKNIRREVFSNRERIPRQGNVSDSVGEDAAGGLVTKPLSNSVVSLRKSENCCQVENKESGEASQINQQRDEKGILMKETFSKAEVARTSRLSLKGIGRRLYETASKIELTHNEEKRDPEDPRKEVCAMNEEGLRKEVAVRNGEVRNTEARKKEAERNRDHIRKETSRKDVAVRVENKEELRMVEAGCKEELKKEGLRKEGAARTEEVRKEGLQKKAAERDEAPKKEQLREPGTIRNEKLRQEGAGRYEAPRKEDLREPGTIRNEKLRKEGAVRHEAPTKGLGAEGGACNEESRKEGTTRNAEYLRKEDSRKEGTTRNEEPRKEIPRRIEDEVSIQNSRQDDELHSGEVSSKGGISDVSSSDNIKPPYKKITQVQQIPEQKVLTNISKETPRVQNGCPPLKSIVSQCSNVGEHGSDVIKRNFDSSALQCDFAVRRRTKVLLKIMVKTPPTTPNSRSDGEPKSKAPSKSPSSTAIDQTVSCVVSGSSHKEQEPPQKTVVADKVVGKPLRDVPQTANQVSRDRSPRDHSKKAYNEAAHTGTLKYVNDVKKRSWNECRRRSRSRSRPRYNKRENFPPVRPDHFHNRHPKGFRSPPPRYRHSRRDDFRAHGFNFSRRSRSLSPQIAFRRRYQRKVERFCRAKLPADKKEREMLLFGTSPGRSPAKHDPLSRPVVLTVNVRRKKNVQLEDEEVNKNPPMLKPTGPSSSRQLVKTPIDFRERYAEVFSNTGDSSDSESGAFYSETESSNSRDSDDSYRPKKKRKAGSRKQTKSKKRRKNDGKGSL